MMVVRANRKGGIIEVLYEYGSGLDVVYRPEVYTMDEQL